MNHKTIELITEYSDQGEILNTETYVTRSNISLGLVYDCVSFLDTLNDNTPNTQQVYMMIDLVTRIYSNQFTNQDLINGLPSHKAVPELYKHIIFVGSGNQISDEIDDDVKEEVKSNTQTVESWKEYKGHLNKIIKDMTGEGKDMNEVLNLPYSFMISDLTEEIRTVKRTESMLDAFL